MSFVMKSPKQNVALYYVDGDILKLKDGCISSLHGKSQSESALKQE